MQTEGGNEAAHAASTASSQRTVAAPGRLWGACWRERQPACSPVPPPPPPPPPAAEEEAGEEDQGVDEDGFSPEERAFLTARRAAVEVPAAVEEQERDRASDAEQGEPAPAPVPER